MGGTARTCLCVLEDVFWEREYMAVMCISYEVYAPAAASCVVQPLLALGGLSLMLAPPVLVSLMISEVVGKFAVKCVVSSLLVLLFFTELSQSTLFAVPTVVHSGSRCFGSI